MTISHLLEDFGPLSRGNPVALTDISLEEQKLESFEKGYQAGWDDSVKAQKDDTRNISADFAQNLQDLTFTYEEAFAAVIQSVSPLLRQMVEVVLPQIARQTMDARVEEILTGLTRKHGRQPVEIVTAPQNIPALETLLEQEQITTFTLSEEVSLAEGQVHIRFGDVEQEVDIETALQGITRALDGFFEENRKETA